ncbi:GntR family transcriptional regulator [Ilumatobacter nonamiensis]|uniref:GntR family transcriptional regulator n=1 Tax=Ilumatobacter nonamiensis TaxID=467093 RepID=UPI000349CBE3|nr:GntR family transcriptional regulator [Ilumatobacter nonamiensis]
MSAELADTTASDAVPAPAFDPSVPLHHQIYLQLRREIADGLWTGRTDFPGEREVAELFDASVITSRSALDRLSTEGWIRRQRGKRPRVIHQPSAGSAAPRPDLMPVGRFRPYSYEVLFAEVRIAPAEACAAFDLEPGSSLWQCSRVRTFDGRPHSVTHNAQRPEVGELHDARGLSSRPMTSLLAKHGHTVATMRRRMSVGQAPPSATAALGITIAKPVLTITFTLHDAADGVIQWVRLYLHPDHATPEETMNIENGSWSAAEPM